MMEVNVTTIQDFLYKLYHNYNLTFALSLFSCSTLEADLDKSDNANPLTDDVPQEDEIESGPFDFVTDFFNSFYEGSGNSIISREESLAEIPECIPLLSFNLNQRFSTYCIAFVIFVLSCYLLFNILYLLNYVFRRVFTKKEEEEEEFTFDNKKEPEHFTEPFEHVSVGHDSKDKRSKSKPPQTVPVTIPARYKNRKGIDKDIQSESSHHMDNLFDSTLSMFLKQLESYLGHEIPQFIHETYSNSASLSSVSGAVKNDRSLQSPRIRRKWKQPQDISPSILLQTQANELNLRNWLKFETFCQRINWTHPKCLLENFDQDQNGKESETLNILFNFLHQNSVTNFVQWNVSTFIVNYSLFVLDEMLNTVNLMDKSSLSVRFDRFESCGSAANGTLVGKTDHFDVMFILDFNKSADLILLQNAYYDEIPPGHVVIQMKDVDGKILSQSNSFLQRNQVKEIFGQFLLCNQIENVVDRMIRDAVNRINAHHKYKMERLPLKMKMSETKNFELWVDASLLNGMGFGLQGLSIRFIPSISIQCSDFSLLPKLYAVPSWRSDHRKTWEGKEKRVGALTKLFRHGSNPRIPANLLWNLSVSEMEDKIVESIEFKFNELGTQNCKEECLMILKALFSMKNKHTLLNRGEISSYLLSTVVNFLFMESSCSAWKMSQLPDRVSDAIHFLRSSYTNILLPNFVIHNPHLIKMIQVLDRFSALLNGRQHNLLADVDADSASKTLAFIDFRLKETGLSKIVKLDYSEEMWEYEFFLFG